MGAGYCGLLMLLLSMLLPLGTEAADYAKICELKYSPVVALEYDPVTGQVSLANDSTIDNDESDVGQRMRGLTRGNSGRIVQLGKLLVDGSNKKLLFLRGNRLLNNNNSSSNLFITENVANAEKIMYSARSCPCDHSGRTYCLVDGTMGSVPDSCGLPWADDIPEKTQSGNNSVSNITDSAEYNIMEIGCFELDSKVVFSRNAWPVIFLWYGALLLFLLFTSNGKYARGYLVHKLCPRLRTNDMEVERIMAERNYSTNRRHVASLQAAQHLAERTERYLVRTPRVRIPSGISWRSGTSDEEQRHDTTRWWLQQAELMGIITRATQPQQVEYVLKTRAFNAERERARRSRLRQISAISNATSDVDDHNHAATLHTTAKCTSNKETGGSSTKGTVATTFSDSEEEQTHGGKLEALDVQPPGVVPQNIFCEGDDLEVFDCSICLTEIEDGEQVGILPCIHIFHVDCLRQWITRKNACPLCQVTEIASPRPVELDSGRRVDHAGEETTTNGGNVPNAEGAMNSHESSDADATATANANAQNTSQIGIAWQLLGSVSSTLDRSALIEMEQRRFRRDQMQQRRQRRLGPREDFVINLRRR